jgi:hypothetical protein
MTILSFLYHPVCRSIVASLRFLRPSRRLFSASQVRQLAAITIATLLLPLSLTAELIPSNRITDWTAGVNVGVPGGIPTDRNTLINVTLPPYNADATGATDAQPAIQAAVHAATSGQVVYLPPGTYRLNRSIGFGIKKYVTIRGAGPKQTTLQYYGTFGAAIAVGSSSDYLWSNPNLKITGSPAKGSTTLYVGDTSALNSYPNGGIGQICQVSLRNDSDVIGVTGFERLQRQKSRIVAKTTTTVTIFPALYFDLPQERQPLLAVASQQAEFVGIEDLKVDGAFCSTPSPLIDFYQAYACWVKNVHVVKTPNYLVHFADSLQCELRYSDLRERQTLGTNGAGFLMGASSACLIEDNVIFRFFPHIQINAGSSGNVFAYNFCEDNAIFGVMGVSILSNHGPHNSYNLYEGNISSKFQSDGYFGGESATTLYRNWFHGTSDSTDQFGICINLNRFSRYFNVVGNILGRPGHTYLYDNNANGTNYSERFIYCLGLPNMGNGGFSGYTPGWADGRRVGAGVLSQTGNVVRTSQAMFVSSDVNRWIHIDDGSGVTSAGRANRITAYVSPTEVTVQDAASYTSTAYTVWPGPGGFQEIDLDVAGTTLRKGNYNYHHNAIPSGESLGGDTLPASLYRASKPAWFGTLAWPAFNPGTPNTTYTAIPAGYRYVHGVDPTGDEVTQPPSPRQPPINVRIQVEAQ